MRPSPDHPAKEGNLPLLLPCVTLLLSTHYLLTPGDNYLLLSTLSRSEDTGSMEAGICSLLCLTHTAHMGNICWMNKVMKYWMGGGSQAPPPP